MVHTCAIFKAVSQPTTGGTSFIVGLGCVITGCTIHVITNFIDNFMSNDVMDTLNKIVENRDLKYDNTAFRTSNEVATFKTAQG